MWRCYCIIVSQKLLWVFNWPIWNSKSEYILTFCEKNNKVRHVFYIDSINTLFVFGASVWLFELVFFSFVFRFVLMMILLNYFFIRLPRKPQQPQISRIYSRSFESKCLLGNHVFHWLVIHKSRIIIQLNLVLHTWNTCIFRQRAFSSISIQIFFVFGFRYSCFPFALVLWK